eukprot:c19826_g1_i2 orf=276-2585(+)
MEEHLKDDERFDASQYAFFGGDVSQEVELGGLDEEDENVLGSAFEEEDERLAGLSEKDEVEALDNVSHLEDVSVDISEVSRSYMNLGLGSVNDPELDHDSHSWYSSHQRQLMQDVHGMRSPNYLSQRPWAGPESEFPQTPFPLAGPYPHMRPQALSAVQSGQQHGAVSHGHMPQNFRPYGPAPRSVPMGGSLSPYVQYGGGHGFSPPAPQGQWMGPPNLQLGVSGGLIHGYMQQQMAQQQTLPPQGLMQRQPGHSRISSANLQQAMFNTMPSAPPMVPKSNDHHHFNTSDGRDFRHDFQQRNRQTGRPQQQGPYDSANLSNRSNSRQHFRSKYMSAEEIESIARIQLAATHSNDSYIDDYYHQAVQAKIAGGMSNSRRQFAPSHLRDSPSHRRAPAMQPTFVPVDGLGRVPFSSIRRPRPLLEVDDYSGQTEGSSESLSLKLSERPLEQEPMLAARIAIEDGLCLLLDVDDIDRFLTATQLPDNGAQLRRQRQLMLEGLAASLQLVDPLTFRGNNDSSLREKSEQLLGAETKDDFVFLRLASLSKGRKLVYRYLQLLPHGSDLVQIVCMAVFRHLRFLFGVAQSEPGAAAATAELANTVADCASQLDLNAISDCLAAVVVSSEQPPLRPFGSTAGDGASVILRSALDRATNLLTDPSFTFPLQDRAVWQATFDRFFLLLYKYCTNKFDSILHSVAMSSPPGRSMAITAAAAGAMSKEMPVELLRASLPHMNENQRKSLLDFTQRSIALGASGGHGSRDSLANNAAAVPG